MRRRILSEFRTARICDCGSHGFVGLARWHVALFPSDKLPLVADVTWSELRTKAGPYARAIRNGKLVLMHRELMGLRAGDGVLVDHKNGDTLDNRFENIRACDWHQNGQNKRQKMSRDLPKGVHRSGRSFVAQICSRGVRQSFGPFETAQEAAAAYDAAAILMHREFAAINQDDRLAKGLKA